MRIFIFVCILGLFANNALAKDKTVLKNGKILAKCYIEIIGGERTIHKVTVKEKALSALPQMIQGKQIRVTGKKGLKSVHKVMECVPEEDAFKAGRARYLEEFQAQ
ncbi:hypothetical protein [Thalassotalea sediminis]|uniref:hypothetical protein n=1 Tax=Thalassotalea sediminis TaxID=1759089 RepID=UPI00257321EE|nr:hypothetical protein [Thalassotalea sediminis]